MSVAARLSPLFQGSTSVTASASPAARPRSSISLEVLRSLLHRAPLHDVVDAALDDEHVRAGQDEVEAARDLVGALAVDRGRPELEPGIRARGPPLPLAALVGRRDPRADGRIGIPQRRACRDRVTRDCHHDPGHLQPSNKSVTCAVRARRRGRSRARPRCGAACRSAADGRHARGERSPTASCRRAPRAGAARDPRAAPLGDSIRDLGEEPAAVARDDPLVEPLDRALCLRARLCRHAKMIATLLCPRSELHRPHRVADADPARARRRA